MCNYKQDARASRKRPKTQDAEIDTCDSGMLIASGGFHTTVHASVQFELRPTYLGIIAKDPRPKSGAIHCAENIATPA